MSGQKLVLVVAGLVWASGITLGARALWSYSVVPGGGAESPLTWPNSSSVGRSSDRYTLVVAAHPRCPCTRATIDGLARVVAATRGRVDAHLLVMKPREFEEGWERTEVWNAAERIPGVRVWVDLDGAQARLFRARTSGQTMLYDPRGQLVFRGGLTPARGHAGPSLGQQSILALVEGRDAPRTLTDVFGCALIDDAE